MLPVSNRQLIILGANFTHASNKVEVNKFHHPIMILAKNKGFFAQSFACRNGQSLNVNMYKSSSWVHPITRSLMDIEK